MCGIVGYVGKNNAVKAVLSGLKNLEYRGYDSAGLAMVGPTAADGMWRVRAANGTVRSTTSPNAPTTHRRTRPPASGTPGGPPTGGPTKTTPTLTPTAPAAWHWSTTASSRITSSCPTS